MFLVQLKWYSLTSLSGVPCPAYKCFVHCFIVSCLSVCSFFFSSLYCLSFYYLWHLITPVFGVFKLVIYFSFYKYIPCRLYDCRRACFECGRLSVWSSVGLNNKNQNKTITMSFDNSLLSSERQVRIQSCWFCVRIMCPIGMWCAPVDCCWFWVRIMCLWSVISVS